MPSQTAFATKLTGYQNAHAFLDSAQTLLDYALQPIVDAHSGDACGYEALLRNVGQLGFQTPIDVFNFAAQQNVLAELELLLRKKAIQKFGALENSRSPNCF